MRCRAVNCFKSLAYFGSRRAGYGWIFIYALYVVALYLINVTLINVIEALYIDCVKEHPQSKREKMCLRAILTDTWQAYSKFNFLFFSFVCISKVAFFCCSLFFCATITLDLIELVLSTLHCCDCLRIFELCLHPHPSSRATRIIYEQNNLFVKHRHTHPPALYASHNYFDGTVRISIYCMIMCTKHEKA